LSLNLSNDWKAARSALIKLDPAALAYLYTSKPLSLGQARFAGAIVSRDPKYMQCVAKTERKGGKTRTVAVAFATLFKRDPTLNIFHLSGSYLQASRLYDYFKPLVTNQELFPAGSLDGEPTRYLTRFKAGGKLEVLTASAKSIRGGDSDILSVDEAVLVPMPLINAAWALPRASRFPKRVITSTASPEVNLAWFVNLWQRAGELRFERFEWPHSECTWLNEEDTALAKLMLDASTYAVEYEGAIADRTGLVWDNLLIDKALVDPRRIEEYPAPAADPLTEKWTSLDWGFVGQAVLLFFERQGRNTYVRDCRIWTETSYTEIKQEIKEDYGQYPIYPDSTNVADNTDLQRMGMTVVPVIASKDKDFLISRIRWRLENGLLKIPNPDITDADRGIDGRKWFTLVQQMKAYHYKNEKPEKVNDHCCDALIYGMKRLEELESSGLPFGGRRRR